jgi:hypothetical protein
MQNVQQLFPIVLQRGLLFGFGVITVNPSVPPVMTFKKNFGHSDFNSFLDKNLLLLLIGEQSRHKLQGH